jgi:hypothetical protein
MKSKFLVICWTIFFSPMFLFSQKIINFDLQSQTFDREYLYFKENFTIKGEAKFRNMIFDSVRVYIYKTRQDNPSVINKVLVRTASFGSKSLENFQGKISYKTGFIWNLIKTIQPLTPEQIATLGAGTTEDEIVFTGRWISPSKDAANFNISVNQHLLFNWKYAVKFVFYPSKAGSFIINAPATAITQAAGSLVGGTTTSVNTEELTGTISQTTQVIAISAGNANIQTSVSQTLHSQPQNSFSTGPDFLLAYDKETLQSRFSVSTGFGGVYFKSDNGNRDGAFLNYIGLKFHFKRVFPTLDDPFFLGWRSRWGIGVGVVTTALKYKETSLVGFGDKATTKPVVFLGYNFHKHFGISVGGIFFKQESGVSTTVKKTIAAAPFITFHVSADVIGLFKTANSAPDPNK